MFCEQIWNTDHFSLKVSATIMGLDLAREIMGIYLNLETGAPKTDGYIFKSGDGAPKLMGTYLNLEKGPQRIIYSETLSIARHL